MENQNFNFKTLEAKRLRPIAVGLLLALVATGAALRGMPAAKAQDLATAALKVESMQLLTQDIGWAAGRKHLLWTTDAGQRWADITPSGMESRSIESVFFLDANQGWVTSSSDTGGELAVSITRNGGATWTRKALATLNEDGGFPISVDFADRQHGWVMVRLPSGANFSRGALLATTDGGQTWKRLPAPPIGSTINFTSPRTGWLAGGPAGDQLYVTRDGGHRWQRQYVRPHSASDPASAPVYQLPTFRNDREGALPVVFGGPGESVLAMYETGDGGATWRSKSVTTLKADAKLDVGVVAAVVSADTVIVAPSHRAGLTVMTQGAQRSSPLPDTLSAQQAITTMDFRTADQGWLTVASGHCEVDKSQCRQESRLFATADGGLTVNEITPMVAADTTEFGIARVTLSTGKGFDKCTIGTVSQMQAWWTNTPWSDANVYIGGGNRGCGQSGLNASWVTSIFNQGWRLIPTWVGPQAPGSSCTGCSKMSTDSNTARTQGINEANAAADTAANLGLPAPTIIYYDMERYDPTSHPAVKSFIDAWVERLGQRGHQAGVYGAGVNATNDWAPIAHPPQAVWIAHWNGNESVWGLSGLPDTLWTNHQRIHQFQGPHDETWGGVTFNIDSNRADGPVADN